MVSSFTNCLEFIHDYSHTAFPFCELSLPVKKSGFGGLEVPKFAGSNPAEAVGFFRAKKSSARLPSEGK